jgi:hypothetical protein
MELGSAAVSRHLAPQSSQKPYSLRALEPQVSHRSIEVIGIVAILT